MSIIDAPVKPSRRKQIIATRGRFPFNIANGAGYTRSESSLTIQTGIQPASNIQVVYTNRQAATLGEIDDINGAGTQVAYQLESMVFQASRVSKVTFNGVQRPTVDIGATLVFSDELGFLVPANTQLIVRSGAIFAASSPVVGNLPSMNGLSKAISAAVVSQVYTTTTFATPSGGASTHFGFGPVCLVGIPKRRHVAVMGWGDSIMYGTGDGTGDAVYGHYGWFDRGLISVNGFQVPFVNCSRSGDSTPGYVLGTSYGRIALLEYVTHAVFGMGTNDIGNGTALATIQANCQAIWAESKRRGVKTYHATITPKTTSTDSWATAANQTVASEYNTAGKRGQFNAWLLTQVTAGNIDGVIDVNAAVADPVNPDKWLTNGAANYPTTDGLHPSGAFHALMATAFSTVASGWSA